MKIGNKVENRLRLFKVKLLRYVPFKIYSMFGLGDMLSKDVLIDKLESFIGNTINNVVLETRDADIIISHANQVLNHEFDILGSGFVRFQPIMASLCGHKKVVVCCGKRKPVSSAVTVTLPFPS